MQHTKLLLTIAFILIVFSRSSLTAQQSTIIISEVLYDTPLNESGALVHEGEFFSLYNYGNYDVDISGWQVEVTSLMSSTQVKYNYTFPDNTIISANSNIVLASRAANSTFEIDVFYSSLSITGKDIILYNNTLTLPNTRSQIKIYNANNILQDEIVYDGTTAGITGEQLLRAENGQNLTRPGNQSASIQRKNITIINNEHVFLRSDYHVHNPKRQVCFFSFDWYSNLTVTIDGNETDLYAFNTEYGPGNGTGTTISSNQNYIFTRTYFNSGTSTVGPASYTKGANNAIGNNDAYEISNHLENIQYFDGLGNLIEVLDKGASPSKKDIVSYIENDAYGQVSKQWLPLHIEQDNGNFVAADYFENLNNNIYNDQAPYSKIIRERSKQNRVIEQYGAGKAWHDNGKSVKTEYLTNVSGECRRYLLGNSNTLVRNGFYFANTLGVTKTTDEDGKEFYQYKDNQGRTLMTRQKDGDNNYDTYYVYDDFSRLRFVIPPKASEMLKVRSATYTETNGTVKNLCYTYRYDDRGNCIYKKIPGAEPIYYIYDKADNLIFSQDGELRAKDRWAFSIPDKYGRVCLTGTCKHNYNYQNSSIKNVIVRAILSTYGSSLGQNGGIAGNADAYLVNTDEELGPSIHTGYYVTGGVLWTFRKYLTVNYYDNYDFYANNNIMVTAGNNLSYNDEVQYGTYEPKAKTLLTGTVTAVLDDYDTPTDYLYSVMYYDGKKRCIQTKSTNAMGGYEKEYINYNFIGQPTKKKHIHSATNKPTITEEYTYIYDHASRLKKTTHKLNDGEVVTLSENTYDEVGRLISTKLNNNAALSQDYDYNVRSWLTEINNIHTSESIMYNDNPSGAPCWNGNISSTTYVSSNGNKLLLNYIYDGLNRLTSAIDARSQVDDPHYSSTYSYDKNGNITGLTRNEGLISNDYEYQYLGNQLAMIGIPTINKAEAVLERAFEEEKKLEVSNLQKIADAAQRVVRGGKNITGEIIIKPYDPNGESDDAPESYESPMYAYDSNGNFQSDYTKGTEYSYNVFNMPEQINVNNSEVRGRITYKYDALGNKLRADYSWKNVTSLETGNGRDEIDGAFNGTGSSIKDKFNKNSTQTIEYSGNKRYKDGSLDMLHIDGGYIRDGKYYFYEKDHLGNNIGVIDANGTLIQQTFYHPYGKPIDDLSYELKASTSQPYKYGGKEEETMLGLAMFDFHARQYYGNSDNRPPVFGQIDPFAGDYTNVSPYMYCLGNPLRIIDPTGMRAEEWNFDKNTGFFTRVSFMGGSQTDYYNVGTTNQDGGFNSEQTVSVDREGKDNINSFRTEETENSTTSSFHIPETDESGFFLEPAGPSTTEANQDKRIPEGSYNMMKNYGTEFPGVPRLFNDDVPEWRGILIHFGNYPKNTAGCLLPGVTKSKDFVGGDSRATSSRINSYVNGKGHSNVKLNIFNVIK
jgi:RHS repeat-associated protein